MTSKIDILIPIYNDAAKLSRFESEYSGLLGSLSSNLELSLIFVDDGSTDSSLSDLTQLSMRLPRCTIVEFSRNFGKEAALAAGYKISKGDAVICIDVDLQDPIDLIPKMIQKWNFNEFDSVIALRSNTQGEVGLRRMLSRLYLSIFNRFTSLGLELNAGETRLINKKMVTAFNSLGENVRFTRGIYKWLGFKTTHIEFIRLKSFNKSNFTVKKLLQLGWNGILSFSELPLRVATLIGLVGSLLTLALSFLVLILRLFSFVTVPGYSSTLLVILFTSSIQLFCIGILGEYIGKTLIESKNRPLYLIRNIIPSQENS